MNPSRLRSLPSLSLSSRCFKDVSSAVPFFVSRTIRTTNHQLIAPLSRLQLSLKTSPFSRAIHNTASRAAVKAPSTYDAEDRAVYGGYDNLNDFWIALIDSLSPFVDKAADDGLIKWEERQFIVDVGIWCYKQSNPHLETVIRESEKGPALVSRACFLLLRNRDCHAGARSLLVQLAFKKEPKAVVYHGQEIMRLRGYVDKGTRNRVHEVAKRGNFPQAAALYGRIIEDENPEEAAKWYRLSLETSQPAPRLKTYEATLPPDNFPQHWELYLGLMTRMGDQEEALRALKIGAEQYDQSKAWAHLATVAHGSGDWKREEYCLLKAAMDGNPLCCYRLGDMYTRGLLARLSRKRLFRKPRIEIKQEIPTKDIEFGKSRELIELEVHSEEWLKLAAEQDIIDAKVKLACLLHMNGQKREGLKLLDDVEASKSLVDDTVYTKMVPELIRHWHDDAAGREALINWSFGPLKS